MDALDHNIREIRSAIAPSAKLMCVIKADGYGHGAVPLAKESEAAGGGLVRGIQPGGGPGAAGSRDSKAHFDSGLYPGQRRPASGPDGDFPGGAFREPRAAAVVLRPGGWNTGKGSYRCRYGNDPDWIKRAEPDPGAGGRGRGPADRGTAWALLEGLFTHFAVADEAEAGADYTKRQYQSFRLVADTLKGWGISIPFCHCEATARESWIILR